MCDSDGVAALDPAIDVVPTTLDLGEIPLGVRAQGAFTMRSTGEVALSISQIELKGDQIFRLINSPIRTLAPTQSDVILVEATPRELGEHRGTLFVHSDATMRPVLMIPVIITGIPVPPCDDGNICTNDAFNTEKNACEHTFADGTVCASADKCIINAVCSQGVCLGETKVCDDESVCTKDYCRQTDGECVFLDNEMACDDDNPCTVDTCEASGCSFSNLPSGSPCDDEDLCTLNDSCFAGECVGTGVTNGSPCDDSDSCTVDDLCFDGVCAGESIVDAAQEGDVVFTYDLTDWPHRSFLHRREVSLSENGVFYGLDHLNLMSGDHLIGFTHVIFAMNQCGTDVYQFAYRPPDTHVMVRFVRRGIQIAPDDSLRSYVGVRHLPDAGYRPETTTYLLDPAGNVTLARIQTLGGETGRSLLPDGSHIYGVIWPVTEGAPVAGQVSEQNLVVVREDVSGNVLWRHERAATIIDWAEFLGVAGPRVLFWASGRFGALDFNTGATVWSSETPFITKEMALSTALNLGVARATNQLIGVEILGGAQVFSFPTIADNRYVPRTDPVISADGRILVLMQRSDENLRPTSLEWVELAPDGTEISSTVLDYIFPDDWGLTRHEDWDDPNPTVADDGVSYVGYGDTFWAINPGGQVRWTHTSTVENAFTGSVPLLRDDGVLLINQMSRSIIGIKSNGGRMDNTGWASFRHDGRRTNFTP